MSKILADVSNALADIVKKASPGVVRVEGRRRLPATGIVWSSDGLIMTASHVIRRDEGIQVGLGDGRAVTAELVGRDHSTDLALLRVDAKDLVPFTEANKQTVNVASIVLALGRPGKTVQATLGIISALGDSWRTGHGGIIDRYLQTDVVMYPGFSGGPLVDAGGGLVGLNSSALVRGVSLALPYVTMARVADSLLVHGRIRRGYLGVSTQRAKLPEATVAELNQKIGLLIVSVESGSPAEVGGLTLGDTIVAVAEKQVESHEDLLACLSGDRINTAVPISILRGGKVETIEVTIGERP